METNLSAGFRARFHSAFGESKRETARAPLGDKFKLEKSLDRPSMEGAIKEGTHPLRFNDLQALKFLGGDVGSRAVIQRTLSPLAFRVSAVNLNKLAKGRDGWKLERVFAGRHFDHREEAPVYTEVETAPGVVEQVLIEGSMILRNAQGEVSIVVTQPSPFGVQIGVLSKKDAQGDGLFKSLDTLNLAENFYKGQKITANGTFLKLSQIVEEDVILPPGMKAEIRRNVAARIERAKEYQEFGLPTKRGLIMAGDPGVGKTMMLKLIAKDLPVTFILAVPTMLRYSEHVAGLYEFARSVAPTIVALEDAETICKMDWQGRDPRLVELLNQLDGVVENSGVTTILTTNYPNQLDRAIKDRPGRFDVRIDVPLSGKAEIVKIIRRNVDRDGKTKYVGSQASLDEIAQRLANARVSGAYVKELVTNASILAIENGRAVNGVLEITAEELGEVARRIIEYKKQMSEEK